MKKILLLLGMVLVVYSIVAQAPQAFKYQAIARDEAGNILSIWDISLRISLIEEGSDVQALYVETHKMQTNIYGLINLVIGEGDVVKGDFSSIKWGENRHYLKIEMDTDGGEEYKEVGTAQLYSVPYALYAEVAGKIAENESSTATSQPQTVRSKSSANNFGRNRNGTPNSKLPADGDSYLNVNIGSVGIGTTLPGGDLEVYKPSGQLNVVLNRATNSSAALLDFQTAGSSEWNIFTPPGGADFHIDRSSGSGDLKLAYSGGNVGIGSGEPDYPLDVTGIVNAGNYYKNGSEFNEGKWSANGSKIYYNSGNVGIGTSNPGHKLDVVDNSSSFILAKSSTGFAGLIIDKGDESKNGYIMYRTAAEAQWYAGLIGDNNFSISKTYISSDGSFYIDQNSNVGIGCTNPDEELVVGTPLGSGWAVPAITVGGTIGGGIELGTATYNLSFDAGSTFQRARIISSDAGGYGDGNIEFMCNNVGIGIAVPAQHLEVYGSGNQYARITSSDHSTAGVELIRPGASYYDWKIENSSNDLYFKFDANEFASTSTTAMYYDQSDRSLKFYKNDGTTISIEIDADYSGDGRIITNELQITGGADIAEPFDISSQEDIIPGMVVSIDKDSPGKLKVADIKYDRCVAGIISGAGNVKTGLFLQDKDTEADGEYPVALTGRVYCWADATHGAIEPGDLLTTSATPGHAMKVTDYGKAQGAILGKAMSSLEEGKGLVFVLVTLQ